MLIYRHTGPAGTALAASAHVKRSEIGIDASLHKLDEAHLNLSLADWPRMRMRPHTNTPASHTSASNATASSPRSHMGSTKRRKQKWIRLHAIKAITCSRQPALIRPWLLHQWERVISMTVSWSRCAVTRKSITATVTCPWCKCWSLHAV